MRIFSLISLLTFALLANESATYFKADEKHRVFCHSSEHSYKMITHENAELVVVHDQVFFKMRDENLYIPPSSCRALDGKKEMLIY